MRVKTGVVEFVLADGRTIILGGNDAAQAEDTKKTAAAVNSQGQKS